MTSNPLLSQCSEAAYLVRVETALHGTLRQAVAALPEPKQPAADARHSLGTIIEAVVGFAFGTVVGGILDATQRWFGADVRLSLERGIVSTGAENRERIDVVYLEDRERRPLVDFFAAQLHVRFARMASDVRRMLEALARIVGATDEASRHRMQVALHLLAQDNHIERRVASEIEHAWAVFTAKGHAAKRGARSEKLWGAWQQAVSGQATVRDEHQAAGYIMLVA